MFAAPKPDPEALPRAIASGVGVVLLAGFTANGILAVWLAGGFLALLLELVALLFGDPAALRVNQWFTPSPPSVDVVEIDLALGAPLPDPVEAGYTEPPMPSEAPSVTETAANEPLTEAREIELQILAMVEADPAYANPPDVLQAEVGMSAMLTDDLSWLSTQGDVAQLGGQGEPGSYGSLAGIRGGVESFPELVGELKCAGRGRQCCIVSVDVSASGRATAATATDCDGVSACPIGCAESAALAARWAPAHDGTGSAVIGATTIVVE